VLDENLKKDMVVGRGIFKKIRRDLERVIGVVNGKMSLGNLDVVKEEKFFPLAKYGGGKHKWRRRRERFPQYSRGRKVL